jgi:hypothetical protein
LALLRDTESITIRIQVEKKDDGQHVLNHRISRAVGRTAVDAAQFARADADTSDKTMVVSSRV